VARAIHPAVASSDGFRACATQPSSSAEKAPYAYTADIWPCALKRVDKDRMSWWCLRTEDVVYE
jgi:hypothetical protein